MASAATAQRHATDTLSKDFTTAFQRCKPFYEEHALHPDIRLRYDILGPRADRCIVRMTVIEAPTHPELLGLRMNCRLNNAYAFQLAFKVASDAPDNPCHCEGPLYARMRQLRREQRTSDGR